MFRFVVCIGFLIVRANRTNFLWKVELHFFPLTAYNLEHLLKLKYFRSSILIFQPDSPKMTRSAFVIRCFPRSQSCSLENSGSLVPIDWLFFPPIIFALFLTEIIASVFETNLWGPLVTFFVVYFSSQCLSVMSWPIKERKAYWKWSNLSFHAVRKWNKTVASTGIFSALF